jgi:hypothetical protein
LKRLGMASVLVLHYRKKSRELHEMAALAPNELLRDQFTGMALQYLDLAVMTEGLRNPLISWDKIPT